ncbi:MAG: hypothetical protein WC428_02225 [Candidatus Paceibacterota bacterium]
MKKAKWVFQFYKSYCFKLIPNFRKNKLLWKDKFESPRCELIPQFRFEWLWFGFYGAQGNDEYWEQWLWLYKYCNGNIEKAKETWGWTDYYTKKSTWNELYVKSPIDYVSKTDRFCMDGDGNPLDDYGTGLGGHPLTLKEFKEKH